MRVLLDECVTSRLKALLPGHEVSAVQDKGWSGKKNGELLELAQAQFDVFLTIDHNLRFQQNLEQFEIAVLIIRVQRNRVRYFQLHIEGIERAISQATPGQLILIGF